MAQYDFETQFTIRYSQFHSLIYSRMQFANQNCIWTNWIFYWCDDSSKIHHWTNMVVVLFIVVKIRLYIFYVPNAIHWVNNRWIRKHQIPNPRIWASEGKMIVTNHFEKWWWFSPQLWRLPFPSIMTCTEREKNNIVFRKS